MNSVELVKAICAERKIAISKLERDCGFSNGYIRKLKEGKFPSDRMKVIADYLDLPLEYLTTGVMPETEENPYYINEETREMAQFLFEHPEHRVLFDASRKLTPEDIQAIVKIINRIGEND